VLENEKEKKKIYEAKERAIKSAKRNGDPVWHKVVPRLL
jgi:hypothetical protein